MAKVLVVGGAGYIGSHVVKELMKSGHVVTVFDNLSTGQEINLFPENRFIRGDIRNPEEIASAMRGQDAVVHLAAKKAVGESMENPMKYSDNNINGSLNILNAMVEAGTKYIVFSSSAAVYGMPEKEEVDEGCPVAPINYYGFTKAEIEKFMGWYDSNPVNLNPLMPSDSAKKWVEYLGDVDKVLQMAKADFDKGEYQWVAEVTNTIVFAAPTTTAARLLCDAALEQLGYQAESGPWRNEYLTAAQELRHGNANFTASTNSTGDMVKALSAPMLFDYMAIVMDKQALADRDFTMNVILPDVGEQHMLRVKNGVLLVYADTLSDDADVSITCPKNALFAILTNNQETVTQAVKVEGSAELLTLMMENMNQIPITGANPFNIIEP